jgi:hypothetical protein
VSGEFDIIIQIGTKIIGVEVKSVGGNQYAIKNQITNFDAKPKLGYTLQVMRYLDYVNGKSLKILSGHDAFSQGHVDYDGSKSWIVETDDTDPDGISIEEFHIIYWSGGEHYAEYALKLHRDGYLMMKKMDRDSDKDYVYHHKFITVEGIRAKSAELLSYLESNTLPPRSYNISFDGREAIFKEQKKLRRKISGYKRRKSFKDASIVGHEETIRLFNEANTRMEVLESDLKSQYEQWLGSMVDFETPSYKKWLSMDRDWQCNYCNFYPYCKRDYNPTVVRDNDDEQETNTKD